MSGQVFCLITLLFLLSTFVSYALIDVLYYSNFPALYTPLFLVHHAISLPSMKLFTSNFLL